jgi:hypothetical protein
MAAITVNGTHLDSYRDWVNNQDTTSGYLSENCAIAIAIRDQFHCNVRVFTEYIELPHGSFAFTDEQKEWIRAADYWVEGYVLHPPANDIVIEFPDWMVQ